MKKSDKMRELIKSLKSMKSEPMMEVKKQPMVEVKEEPMMERADINEDGVVDEKDLEVIEKMVRKKKSKE